MSDAVVEKKKRTRKCREILAVRIVPEEKERLFVMEEIAGWPAGITRATKAIAAAKRIQTEWAKDPAQAGKTMQDIILIRRLATVKGTSQVVMAFSVE